MVIDGSFFGVVFHIILKTGEIEWQYQAKILVTWCIFFACLKFGKPRNQIDQ